MNAATEKIRWGILGPGTIAKAFAGGVAHSRTGTSSPSARAIPARRASPRLSPAPASSTATTRCLSDPGGRCDLHFDAASEPCRMGDQGGGSRQARALRKADGADRLRGRRDDPCGAQGRHLSRRSLHVPPASADGEAGRAGQVGRHRRSAHDQVELRLRHAALHAGAPALRQRPRRRRHPGRRRLSGLDGAADRRGGGGTSLSPNPDKVVGVAHLGQSGVDEWASALLHFPGGIVAEVSCSISLEPGQCAAHPRHEGPHRGQGFLVRRRQGRRHRQDRHHPAATAATERSRCRKTAGSTHSRPMPRARPSSPAGRNSPGPAWAGPTASAICACSTNGEPRSGSNMRSRRLQAASTRFPAGRCDQAARPSDKREIPGPRKADVDGCARLRGFPHLLLGRDPARRLLRGRRQSVRYGLSSTAPAAPRRCSASGCVNRGVREQSVIIGKGAHSPLCYPDVIGKQLTQSLDRLQTDHVDIYFMHRDNPDVPVGEFVDAMDAEVKRRPHSRAVRRLQLDDAAHGRGDRLCRADRQAEARRAFQQFLAGRNAGADLARLRHLAPATNGRPG